VLIVVSTVFFPGCALLVAIHFSASISSSAVIYFVTIVVVVWRKHRRGRVVEEIAQDELKQARLAELTEVVYLAGSGVDWGL